MCAVTTDRLVAVLTETESVIRARFGRRFVGGIVNRMDVDDLIQLVSVRAFAALSQCRAINDVELRHWILTIAKCEFESQVTASRAAKRSVVREETRIDVEVDGRRHCYEPSIVDDDVVGIAEEMESLMAVVNQLPANRRKALCMRYLDSAEYDVIAEEMGITVNAVRLLVSHALKSVREQLA